MSCVMSSLLLLSKPKLCIMFLSFIFQDCTSKLHQIKSTKQTMISWIPSFALILLSTGTSSAEEPHCSAVSGPAPIITDQPELFGFNWDLSNSYVNIVTDDASVGESYIEVPGRNYDRPGDMPFNPFARTVQAFQRPLEVSVDMRVAPGKYAGCLGMAVFPASSCIETGVLCGFQAGTAGHGNNYWVSEKSSFGSTGPQLYTDTGIDSLNWNTVKIELKEDGSNYYYLNDILMKTTNTNGLTEGNIVFVGCAWGQFKNLVVPGCSTNSISLESPTDVPSMKPSDVPPSQAQIPSWIVQHESTIANFNETNDEEEITLVYTIGKNRVARPTLYKEGCEIPLNVEEDSDSFDGISLVYPTTTDIEGDPSNSKYELFLNVVKNATVLDDLLSNGNLLSFCSKVALLDSDDQDFKEAKTDIAITLNFTNTFSVDDISLKQIYVGQDNVTTNVLEYVKACACADGKRYDGLKSASLIPLPLLVMVTMIR